MFVVDEQKKYREDREKEHTVEQLLLHRLKLGVALP